MKNFLTLTQTNEVVSEVSETTATGISVENANIFYEIYQSLIDSFGQDALVSVAGKTQSFLMLIIAFCLSNFMTMVVIIADLAF